MALFNPGREGFMAGEIVWKPTGGSVIKAALLRGYSFNAAHKFVSQVTGAGGSLVATATLANMTNTNGVADADDIAFEDVPEGSAIAHILIYQASAVTGGSDVADTAQRLIALITDAPTLPITPNGQNINVAWSPAADRIFKL